MTDRSLAILAAQRLTGVRFFRQTTLTFYRRDRPHIAIGNGGLYSINGDGSFTYLDVEGGDYHESIAPTLQPCDSNGEVLQ